MCVAIPAGRQPDLQRVELLAGNSSASLGTCSGECGIGWSKWYDVPVIESPTGRVCGKFKNWSDAYDRTIAMRIFYK